MVISLGPGKFYGSSLPRPRFYTDVKFSDERVDPPAPMNDPLLSWATDAHWSMGGLSNKRLRLQGRIEGNIKKLQKEREASEKLRSKSSTPIFSVGDDEPEIEDYLSDSSPSTPIVTKRKSGRTSLEEEGEEEVREEPVAAESGSKKRKLIRKLKDDFDLVADDAVNVKEKEKTAPKKLRMKHGATRGGKPIINGSAAPVSPSPTGDRTSPRLSRNSSIATRPFLSM